MTNMQARDLYDLPWSGRCHCGHIGYEVTGAPKFVFACHCTDCQQLSASAYAIGMLLDSEALVIDEGKLSEYAKTADSGVISRQYSCGRCSTWLYTAKDNTPETVILRPSSLDDRAWVRPVAQIFTDSARPWALLATAFSLPGNVEAPERLIEAFAASDIRPSTLK